MRHAIIYSVVLSLFQIMFSGVAWANNDAVARAQYMLRQLSAEKVKLTAENQNLLAEKKDLEANLKSIEKKYNKLTKKSEKKSSAMSGRIVKLKDKLNEEIAEHKNTTLRLNAVTNEKERIFNIASEQIASIDLCVANNKQLYTINRELLGQYEEKGVWGALSQAEPVTGLKQVEIENLIDDYQYHLDDLRVESTHSELQSEL